HVLLESQRQYFAVNHRQLRDSGRKNSTALEFQQLIELALSDGFKTFNGRDSGFIRRIEAAASPQPEIVDRQVPCHRKQPCVELTPRVVSANLLDHPQPRLLKYIIGGDGILKQSEQEAIQAVLIPSHDGAQRIQFPALE